MALSRIVPSVSIAVPDSCLKDEKTQLDKSRKISALARTAAVFGVGSILVYDDGGPERDRRLLITILRYLDTPPYLRRRLFPRMESLKYAGVLHPLKIPGHNVPARAKQIRAGGVRDGVVIRYKSGALLDIGTDDPVPYRGEADTGRRVTIRFTSGYPEMRYREMPRSDVPEYWGYEAKQRGKLGTVLSGWEGKIILTSRKGKVPGASTLRGYCSGKDPLLLVFGSTDRGIHEILGGHVERYRNSRVLNFFPDQASETVRLEEAILGTLSVLNMGHALYRQEEQRNRGA